MKQQTILIIGCGDIGTELARRLHVAGSRIWGVRRRVEALPGFVHGIAADYTNPEQLADNLAEVKPDYVVVTLTPSAFTEQAYTHSYCGGARNIVAALKHKPRRILFASSTSVYHQSGGEWVDEHSATAPGHFSGEQMLVAEQLMRESACAVTAIRFAGIYGPGRLRLIRQLQNDGQIAATTNFSNRIHRDDCAGMFHHLIALDVQGIEVADCYIGVDNEPAPLADVKFWLARRMGVSVKLDGEVAAERPGNKRCANKRIVASGFQFEYPDYRAGYESLLQLEGL